MYPITVEAFIYFSKTRHASITQPSNYTLGHFCKKMKISVHRDRHTDAHGSFVRHNPWLGVGVFHHHVHLSESLDPSVG